MEYLRRAAQHISDQGRGPDDNLLHVTSNELRYLNQLHPSGQLPRNPKTGLPEAGFFEDILPSVVGIGLNFIPGVGPLLSAAASGLTSAAVTGDLGKGIMSGLLSYGAGSALNSLAGEGAQAATTATGATTGANTAATIGSTVAPDVSQFATTGGIPTGGDFNFGGQLAGANAIPMPAADAASAIPSSSIGSLNTPDFGGISQGSLSQAGTPFASPTGAPSTGSFGLQGAVEPDFTKMSIGDKLNAASTNLSNDPGGTLKRTFMDNAMRTSLPLGVGLVGSMGQKNPELPKELTSEELQRKYPEQFPNPRRVVAPPSDYREGIDPEWNYFEPMASGGGVHGYYAKGGIADANPKASVKANIEAEAKMALLDHHPKAKEALRRYADMFGEDALKALTDQMSSMGGRIRGAGGGLDDLIPGTIEGRKEVRLADGEFVVPADVVSHLGDGSSDHGVRKLTEMMDRIRKTKTGTTKQAGHIKDKKVLPA